MCALYMQRVLINIHTVSPPVEIQILNKDSGKSRSPDSTCLLQ